jgi:hypothetical protein
MSMNEYLGEVLNYGDKRDHKKIDIFVDEKYRSSTTWAKTCKEAKEKFLASNSQLKDSQVRCEISKN